MIQTRVFDIISFSAKAKAREPLFSNFFPRGFFFWSLTRVIEAICTQLHLYFPKG